MPLRKKGKNENKHIQKFRSAVHQVVPSSEGWQLQDERALWQGIQALYGISGERIPFAKALQYFREAYTCVCVVYAKQGLVSFYY